MLRHSRDTQPIVEHYGNICAYKRKGLRDYRAQAISRRGGSGHRRMRINETNPQTLPTTGPCSAGRPGRRHSQTWTKSHAARGDPFCGGPYEADAPRLADHQTRLHNIRGQSNCRQFPIDLQTPLLFSRSRLPPTAFQDAPGAFRFRREGDFRHGGVEAPHATHQLPPGHSGPNSGGRQMGAFIPVGHSVR